MNQYFVKHVRVIVLILVFLFCMAGSQALAADATMVEVSGVTLSAANPYWKNGGGGSASDWNVFLDTSTSPPTLILNDAVIDTMNANDSMIYANGDLVLELRGSSILSHIGSTESSVGIVVEGDLIIKDGTADGTGILNISLEITVFDTYTFGIITEGSITIESGTINIIIDTAGVVYGVYAGENLYVHGGTTNIQASGFAVSAVSVDLFNLTDGFITATTVGVVPDTHALVFTQVLVTGGFGQFVSDGNGFGAIWDMPAAGNFRVLDGQLIFSAREEALFFATDQTFVPYVTDRILVSTDSSGAGKFVWDSSKGILAGNDLVYTGFSYVELLGSGIPFPQTGDSSRLWLWLGIGIVVLLGAGVMLVKYSKHK